MVTLFVRFVPHVITVISLVVIVLVLVAHAGSRGEYVRAHEAAFAFGSWSQEVVRLTFESDGGFLAEALPCPALLERTHVGRHDTFTAQAVVTRSRVPNARDPRPTCEAAPFYFIDIRVGWRDNPAFYSQALVLDTRSARDLVGYVPRGSFHTASPALITALPPIPGEEEP
jgi:hypothetical protein